MEKMADADTSRAPGLPRVLSALDAAMLASGIVVGTGIFAVPGHVAQSLGAPGPILVAWLVGGLVALAGALTYAELASRFPAQGGAFVYVLHAFGPLAGFFLGWGPFVVGFPASSAVVATIFGTYFAAATGLGPAAVRPIAIAAVIAVWLLNLRGTRFSAALQTTFTLAKLVALFALGALALLSGAAHWDSLGPLTSFPWPGISAFGAALVFVFWTYDGWGNLTVVAGEVAGEGRSVARALLATVAIVTSVYLLLNVAYLVLLPLRILAGTDSAASEAAGVMLGAHGARLVATLVALSSFGTLFGIAIAGPRYAWAAAQERLFFRFLAQVDPRTSAPRAGATALFALTLAYLATGTFGDILGLYVAIQGIYVVLSLAAIYPLRRRDAGGASFRVPGFPVVPALAIVAMLGVTASEIHRAPLRTGLGLVVLGLSVPAYAVWRRFAVADRESVR
ncbi:MAG: amino acid permease [bacterium]